MSKPMFHNITETDPKSLEDLILLMAKKRFIAL